MLMIHSSNIVFNIYPLLTCVYHIMYVPNLNVPKNANETKES